MSDAPAAEILALRDAAEAAGLRWCHFKSNEHLGAGLAGLTDLDLLVGHGDRDAFERIATGLGFRRFRPLGGLAYPGVVDFLGCCAATGRLLHLHTHYRLVLGERHLKGYRLPWDDALLAARTTDPVHGFPIACPEWELLLLLVRGALKGRLRDRLLYALGRPWCDDGYLAEYAWLLARVDRGAVRALACTHLGEGAAAVMATILERAPGPASPAALARAIAPALAAHRTHGALAAWWRRHAGELIWLVRGLRRRLARPIAPSKRISERGGVVVAVVGCDGSGKSTLLRELKHWISRKLDVLPLYYGSGDGPVSLARRPLWVVARLRARRRGGGGSASAPSGRPGPVRLAWGWLLALEKAATHRRQIQARNLGSVVLCDRWPQTQHAGFLDGPLLTRATGPIGRLAAACEARTYARLSAAPPDLVIKLLLPGEAAWARKPEGDPEQVRLRAEAVRTLTFPPGTLVVEIDATQAKDVVALAAKRAIWQLL